MPKIYGWLSGSWADTKGRPQLDYLMVLGSVLILTALGLVMVLSSSMTWSVFEGESAWSESLKQTIMVFLGFIVMWVALRTKPRTIRRYSTAIIISAFILLILVLIPGIGAGGTEVGSQSWIVLGPIRFQPSEYAKIATAIWGAHYLSIPRKGSVSIWRHPYTIFLTVTAMIAVLILVQGDLGMTASYTVVVTAMLFFSGFSIRLLIGVFGLFVAAVFAFAIGGGYRNNRIIVFLDAFRGHFEDTRGIAFQSYQGFLSLAEGSLGGVGLGQSRAKWFYLPEAKNDFIFAIIGEEMGLWGASLIIILFTILAIFGIRCATRSVNRYMRLLAATLTCVVVIQAFINMSYVIGLLPVTGIQLPLISAGGTAAVINLGAMGILLSCCRYEPEAISAMQNYGRSGFDHLLHIPEPDVADIDIAHAKSRQSRENKERFGVPVTNRKEPQSRRKTPTRSQHTRSFSTTRSTRDIPRSYSSQSQYGSFNFSEDSDSFLDRNNQASGRNTGLNFEESLRKDGYTDSISDTPRNRRTNRRGPQ